MPLAPPGSTSSDRGILLCRRLGHDDRRSGRVRQRDRLQWRQWWRRRRRCEHRQQHFWQLDFRQRRDRDQSRRRNGRPTTGVTANDFPDSDVGAEQSAELSGDRARSPSTAQNRSVEGSLTSNPNTDYVLNFYSNAEVDASGYGEGETWLGSLDVHTNAQSTVDFSFPLERERARPLHHRDRDRSGTAIPRSSRSRARSCRRSAAFSTSRPGCACRRATTCSSAVSSSTGTDRERSNRAGDRAIVRRFRRERSTGQSHFGIALPGWHHGRDEQQLARRLRKRRSWPPGLAPNDDLESAIVATLDPGAYTAIVRGVNDGTGIGLVETYDLNQAVDSSSGQHQHSRFGRDGRQRHDWRHHRRPG